jgi:hypothetical protein
VACAAALGGHPDYFGDDQEGARIAFFSSWRISFSAASPQSDNNAGTLVVLHQGRCNYISNWEGSI